jgi:hypothetical protein
MRDEHGRTSGGNGYPRGCIGTTTDGEPKDEHVVLA